MCKSYTFHLHILPLSSVKMCFVNVQSLHMMNSLIANKLDGVSLTHFFRNTKKKLGTISQKADGTAIAFEGFEEVPKDSYSLSCRKGFSL